ASTAVADSADLVATIDSAVVTQGTPVHVTVADAGTTVTASSYQWQVSLDGGTTWTNAAGTGNATATYTPTEGDEGGLLRVNVTYTDGSGTTTQLTNTTSAASTAVADSADLGAKIDSAVGTQGTPVHVTVADAGTTVTADSYQWQVSLDGGTTW